MRKLVAPILKSFAWLAAIKMVSFLKVSFIVGSTVALFSATSVVRPLVGCLGSISSVLVVFLLPFLMRLGGVSTVSMLAYHLPGLFASLYWVTRSVFFRVGVPLVCMIAFVVHPIGGQAFLYASYWLIPIIYHLSKKKVLFFEALSSTFIAHAVGSVVWLYTLSMTAEQWYALLPIVPIERLLFATGMVLIYKLVQYAKRVSHKDFFLSLLPIKSTNI